MVANDVLYLIFTAMLVALYNVETIRATARFLSRIFRAKKKLNRKAKKCNFSLVTINISIYRAEKMTINKK